MRPRTKSINRSCEYFDYYDETHSEEIWQQYTIKRIIIDQVKDTMENESRHKMHALPEIEIEIEIEIENENEIDTETTNDIVQPYVTQLYSCSHDRRISFDEQVNVVTIPSRQSLNEEEKRQLWYSLAEFDLMRIQRPCYNQHIDSDEEDQVDDHGEQTGVETMN